DENIAAYREKIDALEKDLNELTVYTIKWYKKLKQKYGSAHPRRTTIQNFNTIEAANVAEANEKLYINRQEGFIGTALSKEKKEEYICNCSNLDDILVIYKDGRFRVSKVQEKMSVGKNILHVSVYKRNEADRITYNVIYQNGKGGIYYMKRFHISGINRDKDYYITQENMPGSKIVWFTANPNGEAEIVKVTLKPKNRLKSLFLDVDFSKLAIKGRGALGNIVTKNEVHKFSIKEKGVSTLGGREVWFDPDILRLNYEGRGNYLGEFAANDLILVILKNGEYYTSTFDATNHYEDNILRIEKFRPGIVWTCILYDAEQQGYPYLKRFTFEPTINKQSFIGDNPKSQLIALSDALGARFEITFGGVDDFKAPLTVGSREFVAVKSLKAKGKRLTNLSVAEIIELTPIQLESDSEIDDEPETGLTDNSIEEDPDNDKSEDEVRDEMLGQQRIF
nr:DNA gyrase/topoisomerase IV subunit A [Paramuribaculum sp.]